MPAINFNKYQGIGNDFVIIDSRKENLQGLNIKELSQEICDRHFGVGADGLLIVETSEKANIKMRIFNPDGSEPEMCGNGIRCFAKYIYETTEEKDRKDILSIETKAGIMVLALMLEDGNLLGVEVDMGIPSEMTNVQLQMSNYGTFDVNKISIGNPHAVIFVDNLSKISIAEVGPKIETDSHFPEGTNVEFIKVINRSEIEMKVWERGAGETLACGTGACAAVAAAILLGKTDKKVTVHLPGGDLEIEWEKEDNHIVMRGSAEKVFEGRYNL